jgi:hypothetical protein
MQCFGGNTQPMWRGDGKKLYYLAQKTLTLDVPVCA